jgi:hypothetical protein
MPALSQNLSLAAPRNSRTANPIGFEMPEAGSPEIGAEENISSVELNVRLSAFRGRKIRNPREVEIHQYLEAERAGLVNQSQALVAVAPQSPAAWARFAQTLISVGAVEEAVRAAIATIEMTSQSSPDDRGNQVTNIARFIAARVLAASGNNADAEAALLAMPSGGPWTVLHAALAEQRGEYQQALERLGEDQSPGALAFRGYLFLQLNQAESALRQLRAARLVGSVSPSLLLNLAYGYALVGASSKAVRAAKQAVVISPADRSASFNLVSYLRASGRMKEALAELRRLQMARGETDPQVSTAIADLYVVFDNPRQALRELRRACHHNKFENRSTAQAELAANTALLEWRLGERTKLSTAEAIRLQLKNVGAHLPLALMLAETLGETSAAGEMQRFYSELQENISESKLLPLKVQVLLLSRDLDNAAKAAASHAAANPLDVRAVYGSIVLYGQITGDYESASKIGKSALRRFPVDRMLINNVAFCLALAGHIREADNLLAKENLDDSYLLATRGLVDLALGKISDGLARYDDAAKCAKSKIARADDAEDFVQLMRTQEVLIMHQFHYSEHAEVPKNLTVARVPRDWHNRTEYLILNRVAQRLDVPWVIDN